MHSTSRNLLAALLTAAAAAASANVDQTPRQSISITSAPSNVAAAQVVLLERGAETIYEMSNGRRMVVMSFGDSIGVRYGRMPMKVLHHDGQGSFASRDGALVLRFEFDGAGDPGRLRLNLPAAWL